jgi:hypothetical protein
VAASLAVEGWGPDALIAAGSADARARLHRWFSGEVGLPT